MNISQKIRYIIRKEINWEIQRYNKSKKEKENKQTKKHYKALKSSHFFDTNVTEIEGPLSRISNFGNI